MHIFYRRPLALFCAVFITGSAIAFFLNLNAKIAVAAVSAAIVVLAFVFLLAVKVKKKRGYLRRGKALCLLAALSLSLCASLALSGIYFDGRYMPLGKYTGSELQIRGIVLSEQYSTGFSNGYTVLVTDMCDVTEDFKARLDCEYVSELRAGYEFEATVRAEQLGMDEYDNSGRLSAIADGALLRFICEKETNCTVLREDVSRADIWAAKLNGSLCRSIEDAVGGEEGRLISALLLGSRDRISYETQRDFRRSGVTHILALSGMHMTVIMGFLDMLLRRIGIPRGSRCFILLAEMAFYLLLTGFAVSAVRAAVMLSCVYISHIFREGNDSITSLFVSGAAILALSPESVADVGFWLSLCATLAIIVSSEFNNSIYRRLYRGGDIKNKGLRKFSAKAISALLGILVSTAAASASTLLIVCLFFGEYSLVTLLGNLLLSSLSTLLLVLSLILVLLLFVPALLPLAAVPARYVSSLILKLARLISDIDGCVISLDYDIVTAIISAMTLALILLLIIRLKRRWMLGLPVAAAAVSIAVCLGIYSLSFSDRLPAEYISEAGGEMIVAVMNGKGIMIDISDGSYSKMRLAAEAAGEHTATEFECIILTHCHKKHIASLSRLARTEKVDNIYLPRPQTEDEADICQGIMLALADTETEIMMYSPEERIYIQDEVAVELSHAYTDRSTHPALTAQIFYGESQLTYIGASACETVPDTLDGGEHIIFGAHGPKIKHPFSLDISSAETVLFADGDCLAAFYPSGEIPQTARIVCSAERQAYTLKREK